MSKERFKDIIKEISILECTDIKDSADKVLTYCAVQLGIDVLAVSSLSEQSSSYLDSKLNVYELKSKGTNLIGESLVELGVLNEGDISLRISDDELENIISNLTVSEFPKVVWHNGSNGCTDIIKCHYILGNKVLHYCLESNTLLYRVSVINIALHNMPCFILQIDNEFVETKDTSIGSKNWEFANKWNPLKEKWLI